MASVVRSAPVLAVVVFLLVTGTIRADEGPGNTLDGFHAPAQDNPCPPDNEIGTIHFWVPKSSPAFETSASLLFLQPSSNNLVYTTVINPFPFLSPHWSDQAVDPRFSPAFNVGLRYVFAGGCDVQLAWTHLNTFDGASTHVPVPYLLGQISGPPSVQALGPPTLIGPPLPFASASALAHFAYDAVNLDAGVFLCAGNHVQVRTFAGVQFARISQNLSTTFQSADGTISFTDVPKSSFTGVGPRLGIDLQYLAGHFNLRGAIAGATLIGGRQSSIDFVTSSPVDTGSALVPNIQYLTSPNSTQVIPSIDARLGAGYAFAVGRIGILKCEAGYQAAVYMNAINQFSLSEVENSLTAPTEGIGAVFLRTATETQSNFFVHGPYARFAFQF